MAQQRFLGFLLGLYCQLTGARGDTDQRKNPRARRTFEFPDNTGSLASSSKAASFLFARRSIRIERNDSTCVRTRFVNFVLFVVPRTCKPSLYRCTNLLLLAGTVRHVRPGQGIQCSFYLTVTPESSRAYRVASRTTCASARPITAPRSPGFPSDSSS